MKMFSNCSGPCETCKTHYTGGCLAGHGDDDYLHADSNWIKTFEATKSVKELEKELVTVLKKIDKVASLKFHDSDCDDCLFNFGGLKYDEKRKEIHIDILMWNDKLHDKEEGE